MLSLLLLPDLRRLRDSCLLREDAAGIWPGIMRGGRSFGDTGGRDPGDTFGSLLAAEFWNESCWIFQLLPGALAERSWKAGRPGIVAGFYRVSTATPQHSGKHNLRESMDDSWTVVMGPSSGTLTFRRREGKLCSLILSRRLPEANLSAFSGFWPIANAKAWSGANPFTGEAVACFSLGNS